MEPATESQTVKTTETVRTIYARRAVRSYQDKPVPIGLVSRVIDAGKMAPSAMNRQPWKFYVLTTSDTIRAFSKEIAASLQDRLHLVPGIDPRAAEDPIFHGAPAVIFLAASRSNEWAPIDIGMCAQNMMLAAHALGLDSCPVGLASAVEKTKIVSTLGLAAADRVYLAVILGYGNETPEVHPREGSNVFFIA